MATLTYVGRIPDSGAEATVVPKSTADALASAAIVTTSIVNNAIATGISDLGWGSINSENYVTTINASTTVAHKTDVDAADNNYLPIGELNNLSGGIAGLDAGGNIIVGQIPAGLKTDRVHTAYSLFSTETSPVGALLSSTTGAIGTTWLSPGLSYTATTTNLRESRLGSIVIPDPGYPWLPLPFGWVQGGSSGGTQPLTGASGTNNYGLLSVMPPATPATQSAPIDQVYGVGICTDSYTNDWYPILPYAAPGQTPTNVPPITGEQELDLYCCCTQGDSYTFWGGFSYWILVVPSV